MTIPTRNHHSTVVVGGNRYFWQLGSPFGGRFSDDKVLSKPPRARETEKQIQLHAIASIRRSARKVPLWVCAQE